MKTQNQPPAAGEAAQKPQVTGWSREHVISLEAENTDMEKQIATLKAENAALVEALGAAAGALDTLLFSREMDSTTRPFYVVRTVRDNARAALAQARQSREGGAK